MTNNDFMMKCTDCANIRRLKTVNSTDRYWLQSICYVEPENALVLCYAQVNTSITSIEKVSCSDMSRISIKNNLSYGHANDITYNPKTNKLYVTPMYETNSGLDRNLIYVLNASTFVKENEFHVGTDTSVSVYGIAYDQINEQYYVAISGGRIAILNSSFEITSTFSFIQHGVNSFGNVFQCVEYYDEKIFLLYSEKIVVFDKEGNYLKNFSIGGNIESEGLASLGNGDFVSGKVYENKKGICISELLSFNILDCRNVTDLLSTEVGVEVKSPAKIVSGINYVKKIGNVVQCIICITNITSIGSTVIATIPEGYRPSHYMRVIGACSGNNFARFEIGTDGNIIIYATSLDSIQSSHWFELEITYLV